LLVFDGIDYLLLAPDDLLAPPDLLGDPEGLEEGEGEGLLYW